MSSLNEEFDKCGKNEGQPILIADLATKQHESPQDLIPEEELSPTVPFPPLPPLPPEDNTNSDPVEIPPLPSDENSSDLLLLSNQPPPPPPETSPCEKTEQLNTSSSQVLISNIDYIFIGPG